MIQQSDGSFANRGTCRNGGVEVPRWAAPAAAMRGESYTNSLKTHYRWAQTTLSVVCAHL